jgi:LPS sulfotransferase NodH
VGHPDEYFLPERIEGPFGAYVERILETGTSLNGVFSAKLMRNYLEDFLFLLRRHTHEYDADDLAVIRRVFPPPAFVWIRRKDTVAQGVSWARASQTGQYAASQDQVGEAVFDFEFIDGLVHLARVQTGSWRRWFAYLDIEPFEVTYEGLCADGVGTTLSVLAFLGLEPSPETSIGPPPELTRQADDLSAEWIAQYRAMAAD